MRFGITGVGRVTKSAADPGEDGVCKRQGSLAQAFALPSELTPRRTADGDR